MADFLFRLAFFAVAPFGIVLAAALFPVRGALVDVGLALLVFLTGEALRVRATRSRVLRWALGQALEFEAYYRSRPPRGFAYYLLYPLLFPYWLTNRDARREFFVFRSYTLGGLLILLGSLAWQYFFSWAPELSVRAFLPAVLVSLVAESLLVLSLLMPIATTVVWYHSSFRRRRLTAVLLVGLASTSFVLARVASRRDPIVSYMTRERVRLRTTAARRSAHRALLAAARAALQGDALAQIEADGKIENDPLDRARTALEGFYKHDEAYAFDLWASSHEPRVLCLYFEARRGKPPIWVAVRRDGHEIRSPKELPKGAFAAMRQAADGSAIAAVWPVDDEPDAQAAPRTAPRRRTH